MVKVWAKWPISLIACLSPSHYLNQWQLIVSLITEFWNFNEIWNKVQKIHIKMSTVKWQPFFMVSVYDTTILPNWRSRRVTVLICAWNIVFQHKINFCVDGEGMECFPCVWLCFISVSFKIILASCVFSLSLSCYRAHDELKMVSNDQTVNTKISWTHKASTNLLGYSLSRCRQSKK